MYDSRGKNRRPRRSSGDSGDAPLKVGDTAPDGLPIIGISDEGRYITAIHDGEVFDPQAEIYEPKGETFNTDLAQVKAKPMCDPDKHVLMAEGEVGDEIPNTQAMKCRRCPYGVYMAS